MGGDTWGGDGMSWGGTPGSRHVKGGHLGGSAMSWVDTWGEGGQNVMGRHLFSKGFLDYLGKALPISLSYTLLDSHSAFMCVLSVCMRACVRVFHCGDPPPISHKF